METLLFKFAFNLIIYELEKKGELTAFEASAARGVEDISSFVAHLKTYADPEKDFPHGKNGA